MTVSLHVQCHIISNFAEPEICGNLYILAKVPAQGLNTLYARLPA